MVALIIKKGPFGGYFFISGEQIPVTICELESSILDHNGRFNSRDYDKRSRKTLCITVTILIKHSGNLSIDSIHLVIVGFRKLSHKKQG